MFEIHATSSSTFEQYFVGPSIDSLLYLSTISFSESLYSNVLFDWWSHWLFSIIFDSLLWTRNYCSKTIRNIRVSTSIIVGDKNITEIFKCRVVSCCCFVYESVSVSEKPLIDLRYSLFNFQSIHFLCRCDMLKSLSFRVGSRHRSILP